MPLSLTFLGAARTVTGSKYLLDTGKARILIDAGLFQGLKELRERNWQDLPIPAGVTRRDRAHARASRSLRLSAAARDAGVSRPRLLHRRHPGSLPHRPARLRAASRKRTRRTPTGTASRSTRRRCRSTAKRTRFARVSLLQPVGYDRPMPVADGVEVEFINAGHLLGSAYARVRDRRARRSCSAAISAASAVRCCRIRRWSRRPTTCWSSPPTATASTTETTTARSSREVIKDDRRARRQAVIIPAFAIGRVEELLYWIEAARRGEADPGAAGVRRQPDGDRGAGALHRTAARARSGDAARGRATTRRRTDERRARAAAKRRRTARPRTPALRVLHRALPHHRVAATNRSS